MQILQWTLWGFSLIAGILAILALFKLRYAERFLPDWKKLKEIESILPMRQDELRQVSEAVDRSRKEHGELEATVGNLRLLKEWENANPEAPARISQMMVDLERSNSDLAAVEHRLAVDQQALSHIAQQTNQLKQEKTQSTSELRILREQLEASTKEKASFQNAIVDLENQHRQLQRNLSDLRSETDKAADGLNSKKSELAAVEKELVDKSQVLSDVILETNQLKIEKAQLTFELDALREQLEPLKKEKINIQNAIVDLENQHRQLKRILSDSRSETEKLTESLKSLSDSANQLEKKRIDAIRERNEAIAAAAAAKSELAGLEKAIEQLRLLAAGMEINLERAGVTSEQSYADLFAEVSFPKLLPSRQQTSEAQALKTVRAYINGRGLTFSERVIFAFHTSLKTSDISPLVVLAGISGTGKSELPRHYSDGMGIHFLLTAIQPRWDSPQDLFGFYNYLEKRYKATELARAMVQFERFNQDDISRAFPNANIVDRSDRLLLVLLDEMNLARTEYYFSEFLSKLETRRMVNESIDTDRVRAEIALDMGSLQSGQHSLRLYPGKNILFVGTMNEDESTQALSDKVIDRASVMRFGRPKRTNPEVNGFLKPQPERGLTFENWNSWMRPSSDLGGYDLDVNRWIEDLNNALDQSARAFAYRTDRAIRAYIANYPREGIAGWHKRAMADQIEQRIFPKLRGFEPDQNMGAIRIIGKIIDELEDEALKIAFRESWESQPSFLFRGVSRNDDE